MINFGFIFKAKLSQDRGLKLPLSLITKSLNSNPNYVANLKVRRVKEFRHYNIPQRRVLGNMMFIKAINFWVLSDKFCHNFAGEVDISLFKPFGGWKGVLALIDCFSRKLWVHLLKTKKKNEVTSALSKILEKSGKFESNKLTWILAIFLIIQS